MRFQNNLFKTLIIIFLTTNFNVFAAGENHPLLKQKWSFQSFFGKFDRASLQRGYRYMQKFVPHVTLCSTYPIET